MEFERKKKNSQSGIQNVFSWTIVWFLSTQCDDLEGITYVRKISGTTNILLWKLNAEVADIIKEVEVVVEKYLCDSTISNVLV